MTTHIVKCIAAAGVMVTLFALPAGIGLAFVVTPVGETAPPVFVAALVSDIPADGLPHRFPVLVSHRNAWSLAPPETIGEVFLRRSPSTREVTAMSAWHNPPLNIPVRFMASERKFVSVCWRVEFDSEGHALTAGFDDLLRIPVAVVDGAVQVEYR